MAIMSTQTTKVNIPATTAIPRTVYYYWGWKELKHIYIEKEYKRVNWDQITASAKLLHSHLTGDTEPDPQPNYTWECGLCPYTNICPKNKKEVINQ